MPNYPVYDPADVEAQLRRLKGDDSFDDALLGRQRGSRARAILSQDEREPARRRPARAGRNSGDDPRRRSLERRRAQFLRSQRRRLARDRALDANRHAAEHPAAALSRAARRRQDILLALAGPGAGRALRRIFDGAGRRSRRARRPLVVVARSAARPCGADPDRRMVRRASHSGRRGRKDPVEQLRQPTRRVSYASRARSPPAPFATPISTSRSEPTRSSGSSPPTRSIRCGLRSSTA